MSSEKKTTVALLVPVTSKGRRYERVVDSELCTIMLPSFLASLRSSHRFRFLIYVGHDKGDRVYDTDEAESELKACLERLLAKQSGEQDVVLQGFYGYADTAGAPCWVWNRLFERAYADGCDYFYQIGDDVKFITPNWLEPFIQTLQRSNGVGVTGPRDLCHPYLLTQSFVSRRHMEIFGSYFPPSIKNWYCDNWITEVYKPNRSTRHADIQVHNQPPDAEDREKSGPTRYPIVHVRRPQLNRMIRDGRQRIAMATATTKPRRLQ